MARNDKLLLEDAEILGGRFRNFRGEAGRYNAEGDRSFCVVVPNELVSTLLEEGWNVKELNGDEEKYFLKVKVSYRFKKPKIVLVTSEQQTLLDEENVDVLDWEDIVSADVYINPSKYQKDDGRVGMSAYLDSLYVTIEEDPLEKKYAHIPKGDSFASVQDDETPF